MDVDKPTYWLFILFRTSLILLGLNVSANTHPLPFYPWKESSRRHFVQTTCEAQKDDLPIPISYKLDSWSQYDNPEEGNAREGDITHHPASRKTITTDEELLWPNGVVRYFIDDSLANQPVQLAILGAAMKNIMDLTCVKFVRIYPDPNGQFPSDTWVNITGNDLGCYSDLGRSAIGHTNLNLDVRKCFRTTGHALHEILHTLGVFHEHMRPDRDEYITILWDNIKEGDTFNFDMMDGHTVTNYGLPYDYDSIMHYSMTAFSKNRSIPTIIPRAEGVEIGQRSHLSLYDVQKLLISYKCDEVDIEYVYEKINQERRTKLALHEEMRRSNAANKSRTTNIGSVKIAKSPRDSDPLCQKSMYQMNIPIIWLPSYKFNYPEYDPNPFWLDYYYYYYG